MIQIPKHKINLLHRTYQILIPGTETGEIYVYILRNWISHLL